MKLYESESIHVALRLSQGFWGTGEKGNYFRGTGKQMPIFDGNIDNIGGTGSIRKKKDFLILGAQGKRPICIRGTREQLPPGRASALQ